jgi:hypothetical protein
MNANFGINRLRNPCRVRLVALACTQGSPLNADNPGLGCVTPSGFSGAHKTLICGHVEHNGNRIHNKDTR